MRRQLRPAVLAAVAVMCAPLAWSQSGSTTYSTSSDQQQADSSNSSSSSTSGDAGYSTSNGQPVTVGTTPPGYWTYQQQQSGSTDTSGTNQAGGDSQQGSPDFSQAGAGGDSQNPGDNGQAGLGGPQDAFSHPEKLPALNLFNDAVTHTGYSFNFSAGTVAQYVSGYAGQPSYWDSLYLATGGINIVQVRSHVLWSAGYSAGINQTAGSVYENYSNLNQSANARIVWQIAKRWQFRLKENYFYSDDPFQPFFEYLGQPQPNYPNPVYYFPQTVVEQNQATGDLTYALGAHDTLNFYGAESFQHYLRGFQTESNLPNFGSLWNSTTYAGGVFYQHQFSRAVSAGEGYVFTALDFGHGQSRAGVNMFQTFVNYRINRSLTISGWVGPEVTGTKDLVPLICFPSGCLIQEFHNSYLNVAEGATLTYAAPNHNNFALQGSNSITNGGGLFGAVKYYQVTATFSRPINRDWGMAVGLLYGHSDSLNSLSSGGASDQFLHAAQGTVSFSRKLNNAWNLNAYYAYIHQTQNYYGQFGVPTTVDTSGLGVTVQYTWNHSLGR